MSTHAANSRRQFLATSAEKVCAGTAGAALVGRLGRPAKANEPTARTLKLSRELDTTVRRPRGLAVDPAGRLFVGHDDGVLVLDSDGQRLTNLATPKPVRCLAVQPKGQLLVGFAREIQAYDSQLKQSAVWGAVPDGSVVNGIACVDQDVFVADSQQRVVWHFDGRGKLRDAVKRTIAGFAAAPAFFTLAAGRDARIHIVNPLRHRIETYRSSGEYESSWGRKSRQLDGFSGCCNPVGLVQLADGRFVTAERGQGVVKLFDRGGHFERVLIDSATAVETPARRSGSDNCETGGVDLAVDTRDRVYVLDRDSGGIRVLA